MSRTASYAWRVWQRWPIRSLEKPNRSRRWLRAAKRQFQGRTPLQLMATEAGARLVEELLYRIDEGMAA